MLTYETSHGLSHIHTVKKIPHFLTKPFTLSEANDDPWMKKLGKIMAYLIGHWNYLLLNWKFPMILVQHSVKI